MRSPSLACSVRNTQTLVRQRTLPDNAPCCASAIEQWRPLAQAQAAKAAQTPRAHTTIRNKPTSLGLAHARGRDDANDERLRALATDLVAEVLCRHAALPGVLLCRSLSVRLSGDIASLRGVRESSAARAS
jgi:hypothetical protein